MKEPQKTALFAFLGYVSQGTALNQLALAISRFTAIIFYSKFSKVRLAYSAERVDYSVDALPREVTRNVRGSVLQ